MSSYRDGLARLLGNPAPRGPRFRVEWPTKDNTDPSWWQKNGRKIKVEDTNMWCMLDLFLNRDPDVTGSRRYIDRLVPAAQGWSINQRIMACVAIMMRDKDPGEYVKLMRGMVGDKRRDNIRGAGIMALSEKATEQYARYLRFYGAAIATALSWINDEFKRDPATEKKYANARRLSIWFLEHVNFWLDSTAFIDLIITAGFRRAFVPEILDEFHHDVLNNEDGDEIERLLDKLDERPGNYMNGGPPRDTGERLMLDAREDGLLVGCDDNHDPLPPRTDHRCALAKIKTREPFPMIVDKTDDRIMCHVPLIHWRPYGDILVAVEMRRSWKEPVQWMLPQNVPPPGEWWGFDIVEKKIKERSLQ